MPLTTIITIIYLNKLSLPVYAATTELKKFFVFDLFIPLSIRIAGSTLVTVFNTPFSSHWNVDPELLRLSSTSANKREIRHYAME